jgi:hypothetical protein
MKIAFHTNQICLQGTEVALFDYADFCEKLLGHKAIILARDNRVTVAGGAGKNQPLALEKFHARFPVFLYRDTSEIEGLLQANNADLLYAIKRGDKDGVESAKIKTVIHTVFKYYEPHGAVYAYVSKWLSDLMSGGRAPFVPHMINLPKVKGDLRAQLLIPDDALVFGRYGGVDSFDVSFVHELIRDLVLKDSRLHFLFMNTNDFLNPRCSIIDKIKAKINPQQHPQIHFLPATSSLPLKSQFINTCDAMLHARFRGETFGIAVGEFSVHNCPVISYAGAGAKDFESNHLEILGQKCFRYNNREELKEILAGFKSKGQAIRTKDWDAYSAEFGPEPVMKKFKDVFLS